MKSLHSVSLPLKLWSRTRRSVEEHEPTRDDEDISQSSSLADPLSSQGGGRPLHLNISPLDENANPRSPLEPMGARGNPPGAQQFSLDPESMDLGGDARGSEARQSFGRELGNLAIRFSLLHDSASLALAFCIADGFMFVIWSFPRLPSRCPWSSACHPCLVSGGGCCERI